MIAESILIFLAHQGGAHAGIVPNTMANFAADSRTDWETDVRFTSTGYPVLLHDPDLRLFGCPATKIMDVSVTAARKCKAPNGATISTLAEFTQAMPGKAWVELKVEPTAKQWDMLDTRLKPVANRLVVESFGTGRLATATKRGYETALLTSTALATVPAGIDWYAPDYHVLTRKAVTTMHAKGIKVATWTINSSPLAVDALIGD